MAYDPSDLRLQFSIDGSPSLPSGPHAPAIAATRLKALENDPAIVDIYLDQRHPLHEARTTERSHLIAIAASAEYQPPTTMHDTAEARRFASGIQDRVNADVRAVHEAEK
jgi:hypothetical protein